MINVERHTLEENGGASYLLSVESNKAGIGQEARVVVCPLLARCEENDLSVAMSAGIGPNWCRTKTYR